MTFNTRFVTFHQNYFDVDFITFFLLFIDPFHTCFSPIMRVLASFSKLFNNNENMNKKNYPIYIKHFFLLSFLILLISFFLIISYLFLGSVVYCDDGSINSLTNMVENLDMEDHAQNRRENDINVNCSTAFIPYQDIIRRRVYWYTCIKSKRTFTSYKNYKEAWDPNIKVLLEIRKELKKDINDELYKFNDKLHKFNVVKNTLNWIFRPSTRRGGGRGS